MKNGAMNVWYFLIGIFILLILIAINPSLISFILWATIIYVICAIVAENIKNAKKKTKGKK